MTKTVISGKTDFEYSCTFFSNISSFEFVWLRDLWGVVEVVKEVVKGDAEYCRWEKEEEEEEEEEKEEEEEEEEEGVVDVFTL